MLGYTRAVTQRATHYHTEAVNPVWSSGLVETTTIGTHIFYRLPSRSERTHYQEALARRRGLAGPSRSASEALVPELEPAEPTPELTEADETIEAAPVAPEAPADGPVEVAGEIAT
jgi:hypothetical protein